MNKRGNIPALILGVVALIAVAVVGFFYLQIPKGESVNVGTYNQMIPDPMPKDETVSWKTYTDKNSYYSINYPPSWNVDDKGTPVLFYSLDRNQSFQIELGQPVWSCCGKEFETKTDEIYIGGLKATRHFYDRSSVGYEYREISITVKENKDDYYIYASSATDFTQIDQILSTFKFL